MSDLNKETDSIDALVASLNFTVKMEVNKFRSMPFFVCGKEITDERVLSSEGAKRFGIALCSFEFAQIFTLQTGIC